MRRGDDWREHERLSIDGRVFWSDGQIEGECRLVNLSAGGLNIAYPAPQLKAGAHLTVSVVINALRLESIPVEVVRTPDDSLVLSDEDGLGLRFIDPSPAFQEKLDRLVHDVLEAS